MGRDSIQFLVILLLAAPCWSQLLISHGSRLRISANYSHISSASPNTVLGHVKFHFDSHKNTPSETTNLLRIISANQSFDCGTEPIKWDKNHPKTSGNSTSDRRVLFQLIDGRLICGDKTNLTESPLNLPSHVDTLVLELEFFPEMKNVSSCAKLEIFSKEVNCSNEHLLQTNDPQIELEPLNIRCDSGCEHQMKFAIDKKKVNETTTKPSVTLAAVSEKSHNGPTEHSPSTSLSHCNGHRGAEGEIETCEENADNFPCRPDEVCLRIKNNPVVGDFLCAKWKANADQSNFTCDYFSSLNSSLFSASLIGEAKEDNSIVFRKVHRDPPSILAAGSLAIPTPPVFLAKRKDNDSVANINKTETTKVYKQPLKQQGTNETATTISSAAVEVSTELNGTTTTVSVKQPAISPSVVSVTDTSESTTVTVPTELTTAVTSAVTTTVVSTETTKLSSTSTIVSTTAASSGSSSDVGAIVGGIFGSILFIGLIVGGYFLFRYIRRSRKLKGKYNPAKEEMSAGGANPLPMVAVGKEERLI